MERRRVFRITPAERRARARLHARLVRFVRHGRSIEEKSRERDAMRGPLVFFAAIDRRPS